MANPDAILVNVGGTKKKIYQDLSRDFSAMDPPFWAALTAAFLRKNGLKVEILDASVENLTVTETAPILKAKNPRWVVIVVYSQQANTCTPIMDAVGQLCREIKRIDPQRLVVFSGWQPSAIPERTMREEVCDCVAQGEGFHTLLDLLRNRPYNEIPGLWWRKDAQIIGNARQPNIQNLSAELDEVAWDLLPLKSDRYRAFNWMCLSDLQSRSRFVSMMTSLGCPFRCSFCAIHSVFGERKVRYWSTDWVLKQFDILINQYQVKNINLNDEQFIFNRNHFMPIARGILDRGYKLNICSFARVDVIDALPINDLRLLKKAGFNWFKLGIETGVRRCLKNVRKGNYTKQDIRRVVRKIHQAGIHLCANFMFGLPGDTWDSMQDTLNFAFELNAAFPSFFCTMAVPGSDLYFEAMQKGIPLPDKWVGYASQGYDFMPLATATLTAAEVVQFRDYAFHAYFTNPRYLCAIEEKFGPEARAHVQMMTAIRLKRKLLGD